ncbi:hypothetical protein ACFL2T_00375 [Elusimicrobiota bacterium]
MSYPEITPEERLRRIGRILAKGILILHEREKKARMSGPQAGASEPAQPTPSRSKMGP